MLWCLVHVKRINRLNFIVLFLFTRILLTGQADSVFSLPPVEVTAQRISLTGIGKHTDNLDSQNITSIENENLATQLIRQTPLYVRTYGEGTLATLGIRGGNATHTQILWNGIPLRNPMIGLTDLALIPSVFVDRTAVHYGGHGAAFGSGAVGGLISLSNAQVMTTSGVDLHLAAGSWDTWIGEVKMDYGIKKLRFSTRLFSHTAENNFRYKLQNDLPEKTQVHHELKNQGLLQEVFFPIGTHHHITARLWYQYTDRQIPPTSTQTFSQAAQQDENLRVSLHYSGSAEKIQWQWKAAMIDEQIDYQDSLMLLYTENKFRTWLTEASGVIGLNDRISMTGGLYAAYDQGESANYIGNITRHQYAAYASLRYLQEDWVFRAQMREELTDKDWSPLLLDLSGEWSGIRYLTFKASISRNYRIPTLNDLYWQPGGNPALQPEKGWTIEGGAYFQKTGHKTVFTTSVTGYTRKIDEWIMWMPPVKDVSNYWTPLNVSEVNSRGIEIRLDGKYSPGSFEFLLISGVDLTWSTFGTDLPDFNIQEGDQLFYVPVENIMAGLQVDWYNLSGYYHHRWFGPSPGINVDVEAGNVAYAGLSFGHIFSKVKTSVYIQMDNVWNVAYRVIERRPMPGRSFQAGIKLSLHSG